MINPYLPKLARIEKIKDETFDTKLFTLRYADGSGFEYIRGQFIQAGIFGFGEAPFTLCSATSQKNVFEIAVRNVGILTEKMHTLTVGDNITVRGPFGNGFPMEKFANKNVLLIGGGCGFAVMRPFVLDYISGAFNKQNKLQVFYGCLDEKNLLFFDEEKKWREKVDFQISLSRPSKNWKGITGVVTKIFEKVKVLQNAVAVVVGPPIMYKFVVEELKKNKFSDSDIFLSLERKMYCGLGVCQHCAIGPYYVCKDGPVFSYEQIKGIKGAI